MSNKSEFGTTATMDKKKKKKKVSFNFQGGKSVMRTIEVEDYEPFQITFRIPTGAAGVDIAMDATEEVTGDDELESKGLALIKFAARHLETWSLPESPTLKSLLAIHDASILMSICNAITTSAKEEVEKAEKN